MPKLFLKLSIFTIGIGVIFNILGSFADKIAPVDDWRIPYQEKVENLYARKDMIEAIALGNSHSDSIDYSVLGIEGQSIALAYADLFELEKSVEYLEDSLPNLDTVFITISYYSFSRDNAEVRPFRSRRISFYSIIPIESPIQGDLPNYLMGRVEAYTHVMSVVRSDNWKNVWLGLFRTSPLTDPFPYNGVQTNSIWGECFHYTAEQLDNHAKEIAWRNVSSSIQMANVHHELEQDSLEALARIIERLQSRGIRVILYTPTYYEKYNTYFEEDGSFMIDHMRQAIGNLQKKYGVEYFDFSHDPTIMKYPELFYNSDHLGECGKKVISEKLLEQMQGSEKPSK